MCAIITIVKVVAYTREKVLCFLNGLLYPELYFVVFLGLCWCSLNSILTVSCLRLLWDIRMLLAIINV